MMTMLRQLREKPNLYLDDMIALGIVRNDDQLYRLQKRHGFPKGHKREGAARNEKPHWPRHELKAWCETHEMGHIFAEPGEKREEEPTIADQLGKSSIWDTDA